MNTPEMQVEVMRAAGLDDNSILRLAEIKGKIATGALDDLAIEYKRAMFLKHLVDRGKLREWAVTKTPVQKHFSGPEPLNPSESSDINSQP
ncbi:hypothetical protein A3B39_05005 [Candidatus Daviesbacteria bacterium RIFCSPLOWO2_01_FULL_37_10]|nr:MAG: hypothetical protein A3B39_05005 [Candidatus Daviesbacteria bacterium RIFCSPLOWO2_01_FULL_37_10]